MRVVVVAGFGALGALLRWALGVVTHGPDQALPWTTLGINVAGCFALGLLIAATGDDHPLLRLGLGTGFLGAFTTFSTFSVEATDLSAPRGAVYIGLSVALGLLAAVAGRALGDALR